MLFDLLRSKLSEFSATSGCRIASLFPLQAAYLGLTKARFAESDLVSHGLPPSLALVSRAFFWTPASSLSLLLVSPDCLAVGQNAGAPPIPQVSLRFAFCLFFIFLFFPFFFSVG